MSAENKAVINSEGFCPHCNGELVLSKDDIKGKSPIECPLCKEDFSLKEFTEYSKTKACPKCGKEIKREARRCKFCKSNIDIEDQRKSLRSDTKRNVQDSSDLNTEFSNSLSSFRIYTILTVIFDFLFIFTILGFGERGKLNRLGKSQDIDVSMRGNYRTWEFIFLLVFFLKILVVIASFCGYFSDYSY